MKALEERKALIKKVFEGSISLEEVKNEVKRLERQYGEDVFSPLSFIPQERPWTVEYLNQLENLSLAGAGSKEFILHIAEVKQELSKGRNKKSRNKNILMVATVLIFLIVACFLITTFLFKK
ncbi:hypothetical protein EII17_01910 [Clostridiales bacterium COT073_COT-073]|nr:hypothetical protein EII17_01910 [Clostridiales bacterium COT073_COT-073]